MAHKVYICGVDTSSLPKLTREEMSTYMHKLKQGDEDARQTFISANLRLVLSIVQRFGAKCDADDLFQVGCVGLLKAIKNFDERFDVMFSTYAVPMIIGEIRRFVRDANSLKISRKIRDIAYQSLTCRDRLVRDGLEGNSLEIAREIDVPVRDVEDALNAVSDPVSIYDNVFSEDGDSIDLLAQLYDKKQTEDNWIEDISLREALKEIPDREREILDLRYFKGHTQMEISRLVGISQAQVSRLEKCAIERLRKALS
ncbi:MAG: sigma-70 family RNA polymerase sigma factor [Clostridia bacterium]|nr:sigma-70 family RNA polymerase sigma factor [Clostridia bacterium]MBR7159421.1 sigma-70 family RNA polymerase sigma factor [Clostridia bacterium]